MPSCLAKNDPGPELTTCENRSDERCGATELPSIFFRGRTCRIRQPYRGRTYFRVRTVGSMASNGRFKHQPETNVAPATSQTRRPVAVLGGNRIPFARSDGAYAEASNQDMFTAALGGLVDRFGLAGDRLGVVAGGAVLKHSRDFNLMRECVLGSALSAYTPAFDLQQACGTGLQAAIAAADGIAAGRYAAAAAGGGDTTSDAPIALGNNLRHTLLGLRRSKSNLDRLKLVGKLPASVGVEIPVNSEPRTGLSMGEHQAITAKRMGIKRVDQDELAAASHRNMAAAYDRGFFDDLVPPFLGLYRDNNLRSDSSTEKLAKLRPVFGVKAGDATMTAGNSTPLTDGASVALLSSE